MTFVWTAQSVIGAVILGGFAIALMALYVALCIRAGWQLLKRKVKS